MHIVDIFGRIFISALFLIEAVRKFFDPDISMMYMSDHHVPEFLFYPSIACLLYTSPSPRDGLLSRMPSSA